MTAQYTSEIGAALEQYDFDSILELACGDQQNLKEIQSRKPNVKIHGCDIEGKWGMDVFDITQPLPYEDKSYDVVLLAMTLLVFSDKTCEGILKQAQRIARKMIVLCEPHTDIEGEEDRSIDSYNKPYVRDYRKYFSGKSITITKNKAAGHLIIVIL